MSKKLLLFSFLISNAALLAQPIEVQKPPQKEILYQEKSFLSKTPRVLITYQRTNELPKAEHTITFAEEDANKLWMFIFPNSHEQATKTTSEAVEELLSLTEGATSTSTLITFYKQLGETTPTTIHVEFCFASSKNTPETKSETQEAQISIKISGPTKPSFLMINLLKSIAVPDTFIQKNPGKIAIATIAAAGTGAFLATPAYKRRSHEANDALLACVERVAQALQKKFSTSDAETCFQQAVIEEKTLYFFEKLPQTARKLYNPTWKALEPAPTPEDKTKASLLIVHTPTRESADAFIKKPLEHNAKYKYLIMPLSAFNPRTLFYQITSRTWSQERIDGLRNGGWQIVVINNEGPGLLDFGREYPYEKFQVLNGCIDDSTHDRTDIREYKDYTLPGIFITGKDFTNPEKFSGKIYWFEKKPTSDYGSNITEQIITRSDSNQSPEDFLCENI